MSTNLRWSRPEPPAVHSPRHRRPVFWAVVSVVAVVAITLVVALVLTNRDEPGSGAPLETTPSADFATGAGPDLAFLVGPGWAGPYRIGDNGHDLANDGLVVADPDFNCGQAWAPVADTRRSGFFLSFRLGSDDDLDQIFIKDPDAGGRSDWQTEAGAGVGTSLAELKRLYGPQLVHHRWPMVDGGHASDTWTLLGPQGSLTFDFGRVVNDDSARVLALEITGARDLAHLQPPDLGC